MSIFDNFMEEDIFYLQKKQEHEWRAWCEYVEQKEAEEKAYLSQAEQYFRDLEQMENQLESI